MHYERIQFYINFPSSRFDRECVNFLKNQTLIWKNHWGNGENYPIYGHTEGGTRSWLACPVNVTASFNVMERHSLILCDNNFRYYLHVRMFSSPSESEESKFLSLKSNKNTRLAVNEKKAKILLCRKLMVKPISKNIVLWKVFHVLD